MTVAGAAAPARRVPRGSGGARHRVGGVRADSVGKIDWDALRTAAVEVMGHAYAPYSRFPVGAAGLVDDGRIVTGCNVENAAYGAALCAECGMVSAMQASGGGRLVAVACVDAAGKPLMPCGQCRQILSEHGGPECLLDTVSGARPMAEILPDAFGPEDLAGH